jgi:dUTP pyrophosphatase
MFLQASTMFPDVKVPERSNPSDAGLDVFLYSPDKEIVLYPNQSQVLSTGIKVEVPHGMMLQVMNRSSVASKQQLLVGACVIDSGYSGEITINLHNVGSEIRRLKHHDKIAQLVCFPVYTPRLILCDEQELYDEPVTISSRGQGGFGSTGK